MKDDEVARIRLEEKENFHRELDKARKDVSVLTQPLVLCTLRNVSLFNVVCRFFFQNQTFSKKFRNVIRVTNSLTLD